MARHLKPHRRAMIIHMFRSQRFTLQQIADAAKCSRRSVSYIHRKLRKFGSAKPLIHAGRSPTLTRLVLDTLCEHLIRKPGLYIDEMVTFLWKEFNIFPSYSSIQQALTRRGWTKKKLQQKAKEQNPQLRAFYQHKLSQFHSYQLVFVDESGCDKRIGCRQTGLVSSWCNASPNIQISSRPTVSDTARICPRRDHYLRYLSRLN